MTACFAVWDPVRGYHQGQQSLPRLHQQAGQKSAPDQRHIITFALAMREPSTEDVRRSDYASLSHLKQYPVDIIKIDQSFVHDLENNPDDSAIIRALIGLGKSLSIGIVAEGIEDYAQAASLAELGCDYGQGYLFSKAIKAADVPKLLSQWQYRTCSTAQLR